MRVAASALFLVAAAALSWAVALGRVDLLAIAPLPLREEDGQKSAIAGARSLRGFSMQRLSYADGTPIWSATGVSLERSGPDLVARDPRIVVWSKGGGTSLAAPRARFSTEKGGSPFGAGPVEGELEGGVSIVGSAIALATERLVVELPAGVGSAAHARKRLPSFETRTPVTGTLVRARTAGLPAVTGLLAEGGCTARGDLRRLELRGPVSIRDSRGELLLDATRDATIVLAAAPWRVVAPFEGTLGALAGLPLLGREAHGGWVIALIEARGAVRLEMRGERGGALEARGERIVARPVAGTLRIEGERSSLVETTSGCSVTAPWIFARDVGTEGLEVTARGGVVLGARTPAAAATRDWVVEGDHAVALLVSATPVKGKVAPGGAEQRIRSASVETSAAHPGRLRSVDGHFHGRFERFSMLEDAVAGRAATITGSPAELVGTDTRLRARSIDFLGSPGSADRVVLEGDVLVRLGEDLRDIAPVVTSAPIEASGARVELLLDPSPVAAKAAHAAPWWRRGQLLDARIVGEPGRLDTVRPGGEPFHLEGGALHFDAERGLLRADAAATATAAVAVLGSAQLAARRLDADLAKGQLDARGAVRARAVRPEGDFVLACEHARWDLVLDPAKRKPRVPRRALGVPDELLGFTAEDSVKVDGVDGLLIEADVVDLHEGTLVATRRTGRVHATAQGTEVLARRIEARDLGEDARSLDLLGEASIARTDSGTVTTLAADRVRALGFVHAPLGKPEVLWGPIVAWQEGPGLVALRSKGPEGDFEGHGRVLRLYPRSGLASLTGSVSGTLVGKNGIPLAFTAPRAQVQLDAAEVRSPHKKTASAPRGEASSRIFSALKNFKRFGSAGGVHATYKDQTFDADSMDYDGHQAVLKGEPVRVRDSVKGIDYQTRKMTLDLDTPGR